MLKWGLLSSTPQLLIQQVWAAWRICINKKVPGEAVDTDRSKHNQPVYTVDFLLCAEKPNHFFKVYFFQIPIRFPISRHKSASVFVLMVEINYHNEEVETKVSNTHLTKLIFLPP